jgi:phosphoribosylglycinamide formyltransferase-1
VLAGFMRILTEKITKNFYGQIINIHPSLLPKYPGLNTHQQVIDNKDMTHGITIHYVSSELDGGPIIAQGEVMTSEDDDIDNLIERIHTLEHKLYPEIIKYICDNQINIYSNEVIFKNLSIKGTHIYKKYDI